MIPLFNVFMAPEVDEELIRVLHSGYIGEGRKVEQFERELKLFLDTDNLVTLNSGTAGLQMALRLAGVERGHVISTPLTCTATNWPILQAGAGIIWADIDEDTGNISPASISDRLREASRSRVPVNAIMVVHWGGYPCDMEKIWDIAYAYNIPVIEDCAHAFGATYNNMQVGAVSDYAMFSLQAIKHITSGDGGILTMRDSDAYGRAKLLKWYGIDRSATCKDLRCEADVIEWGYKAHMNDINATIGLANLQYVNTILEQHRDCAEYYKNNLADVPGVTLLKEEDNRESAYWLFTMKVENRDAFMDYMTYKGIMTSKVHARNDTHSCVARWKRDLPSVDKFVKEMICIPIGQHVSQEDREYIVETIKAGW